MSGVAGDDGQQDGIFWTEKVFDEDEIMASPIYIQQAQLLDDPRLKGNDMHRKLCVRLSAFYIN